MGKHDQIEINQALIKVFDDLLEKGDWESTLFLRVSGERIKKLRQQAQVLLDSGAKASEGEENVFNTEGYTLVYVSLFHVSGGDLKRWQYHLKSLDSYALSRPVYQREADVQKMIRSRPAPENEAYVAVWIKNEGILERTGDQAKQDRGGHPLFTLKAGAFKNSHIEKFVHNALDYSFDGNRLIERINASSDKVKERVSKENAEK